MDNQQPRPPKGNFISSAVNPRKNQAGMERHVLLAETVAKLVAVLITSLGFFVWGQDIAAQYSSNEYVHLGTGLVFAAVAAWITDFAFSHFLENAMFQLINFFSFNWFGNIARDGIYITLFLKPLRWIVVTGIVAGLFWADWNSVVTLRSPIANAKQEKAERVDWQRLDAAQAASIKTQLAPIDSELKTVRNRIAATERKTKEANAALVKLVKEHDNDWAASELRKRQDRATKADRDRLANLETQRDHVYASVTTAAADQRQLALKDDNEAILTETESKMAIATLFTMFGLGAKILTICFRLFLVINFLITKPGDVNGDGEINGADVTAHARNSRNNYGAPAGPPSTATGAPAFAEGNRIGFKHYDFHSKQPEGRTGFNMQAAATNAVPQPGTAVEQRSTSYHTYTEQPEQPVYNGPQHMVADVKEWCKRAQQTYTRSHTSKSQDAREDNMQRFKVFRAMLETVGADVYESPDGNLRYKLPARYEVTQSTADALRRLSNELDNITARRKRATV